MARRKSAHFQSLGMTPGGGGGGGPFGALVGTAAAASTKGSGPVAPCVSLLGQEIHFHLLLSGPLYCQKRPMQLADEWLQRVDILCRPLLPSHSQLV